ncbi:MAG: DUF1800 domain-containing protein, partial [Armatimonadetes bacterium]|nr:DUF1800 domain-containing protein [Armatimonadota bacterium]
MSIKRRDLFRWGATAGAGSLLTGCSRVVHRVTAPAFPEAFALPPGEIGPEVRLLNRIGFGPAPGEVERVKAMGIPAFVEEQLHPPEEDLNRDLRGEGRNLALRLRGIDALREHPMELRDLPDYEVLAQIQQAAILRAVYSPHSLRERMVDFWGNHFNIYGFKGWSGFFKPRDEIEVIRRHALGTFPDLLRASARSPAMLIYLDNEVNARGVPNENYARELMELHTLGVHGGYTQKDVQEVARCLTGWTLEDRFLRRKGTFRFDPAQHDDGPKTVLGTTIPSGGGEHDGERVLEILAHHPATAAFIAGKLCRHFLGEINPAWEAKLAAIYAKTGGDIPAMLRPLLLSPDLLAAPPVMKRPYDYMISALRALHADTDGGKPLQAHLSRMGQPLYQWPMPDGYPDRTSAWTGSLLARWNFALALAAGEIEGTTLPLSRLADSCAKDTGHAPADALITLVLSCPPDGPQARRIRPAMKD